MAIQKAMLQAFKVDFAEAMKPLEEKYGCAIALGTISYGDQSFDAHVFGEVLYHTRQGWAVGQHEEA